MNTELRKRLEEAAKRLVNRGWGDVESAITKGAELGYKEAITQAKKWLEAKLYCKPFDYMWQVNDFVERFETCMNKLWEDRNEND